MVKATLLLLGSAVLAACGTSGSSSTTAAKAGGVVQVVAAENFWGSIASQVGGSHVHAASIITNPDTDRDDYETIAAIKAKFAGTKVGASESIFEMLAPALGLDLITPPSFLKAISQGTDVSAGDKQTIDEQIKNHEIKIYVYNSQNVTPDVQAQLTEVKAQRIPYATITETLTPANATYQEWQTTQLLGIQAALAEAGVG